MYQYEKGFVTTVFILTAFLAWQLLKTLFYRLPKVLARLGTRHN